MLFMYCIVFFVFFLQEIDCLLASLIMLCLLFENDSLFPLAFIPLSFIDMRSKRGLPFMNNFFALLHLVDLLNAVAQGL